jgi:hypothetical protein
MEKGEINLQIGRHYLPAASILLSNTYYLGLIKTL